MYVHKSGTYTVAPAPAGSAGSVGGWSRGLGAHAGQPGAFLKPDDLLLVGPRPSGERTWVERLERWNAGLAAGDTEGLWGLWCEAAESWLVGWAGREDPACCGRGRMRRIRRLPAEGQRGPVGLGEVGRRAQGWLKA